MAGDGPRRAVVEEAADRVVVRGYVSDEEKWRWFTDADCFTSLSAYEGMPVATMEALSFGVPVVLSNIPAHRVVIDDYGATGTLVDDDPAEIATAVRRLHGEIADVTLPTWQEIAIEYLDFVE